MQTPDSHPLHSSLCGLLCKSLLPLQPRTAVSASLVYWCCCSAAQSCPALCSPMDYRLLCPSLSSGICLNSCPLSRWYHPTISSSVIPFSSCPQSFWASGSFPMSWLFAWGGQSIGASASESVFQVNIQDGFHYDWLIWSLAVQGTLKSLLQHHSSKTLVLWHSAFFRHCGSS